MIVFKKDFVGQKLIIPVLLLSSVFFFFQCKKENLPEKNVLPNSDLLETFTTDTLSLNFSQVQDSVVTNDDSLVVLGKYTDDAFGDISANFNAQFKLSTNAPSITEGKRYIVDTVYLRLRYSGLYGKMITASELSVKELEGSIESKKYYQNSSLALKQEELLVNTSTSLDTSNSTDLIKGSKSIYLQKELKKSFGEKLLSYFGKDEVKDSEAFLKVIKGLNISMTSGNGGIYYWDPISGSSEIVVHYTEINATDDKDSVAKKFSFPLNRTTRYFSQITDQYAAVPEIQSLLDKRSLVTNRMYLQAGTGLSLNFIVPYLEKLKDSSYKILGATIHLPVELSSDSLAPLPFLNCFGVKNDTLVPLKDQLLGTAFIGGVYSKKDTSYSFNIPSALYDVLNKNADYSEFRIQPSFGSLSVSRTLLRGKSAVKQPKLTITYTK